MTAKAHGPTVTQLALHNTTAKLPDATVAANSGHLSGTAGKPQHAAKKLPNATVAANTGLPPRTTGKPQHEAEKLPVSATALGNQVPKERHVRPKNVAAELHDAADQVRAAAADTGFRTRRPHLAQAATALAGTLRSSAAVMSPHHDTAAPEAFPAGALLHSVEAFKMTEPGDNAHPHSEAGEGVELRGGAPEVALDGTAAEAFDELPDEERGRRWTGRRRYPDGGARGKSQRSAAGAPTAPALALVLFAAATGLTSATGVRN